MVREGYEAMAIWAVALVLAAPMSLVRWPMTLLIDLALRARLGCRARPACAYRYQEHSNSQGASHETLDVEQASLKDSNALDLRVHRATCAQLQQIGRLARDARQQARAAGV